ncbi:hypothetical protein L3Q82_001489 [Scortum barcoo]|uniref:Uncharacterized protein n=1 Tax=Scortum barcoo TaxID=214431 RepID=A0ACB8W889_9TELE|nr:hypothetical protein L3Q82_001489 [Scortum barcoo]
MTSAKILWDFQIQTDKQCFDKNGSIHSPGQLQRSDSPAPSCVSMKSDSSMNIPLDFKEQPPSEIKVQESSEGPDGQSTQQKQTDLDSIFMRTDSAAPSCVSMKSDWSMMNPLGFKGKLPKVQESSEGPDGQSTQQQQTDLDSIFMLVEEHIASFVKDELKRFQKILSLNPESLKRQDEEVDRITKAGNPTSLKQIYTELYITEGGTAEVNDEHEIRQIDSASRKPNRPETTIRCEDIFKPSNYRDQPIRVVMTEGVASIGKTVLTQKFTLDWAEDKANQDIQFMFPIAFRELNVLKEKKFSLVELVHQFFTETKEAGICRFEEFQVVFIFDGLDECRLPLDFHNNEILTDVHRVHLSGCAADKPHQGETASLCSPLDNHTTCSSQSDPS